MRLLIVTSHPHLHAPRRLAKAAAARRIAVEFVVPPDPRAPASALPPARGALLLARPGPFSLVRVLRTWRALVLRGARPLQSRHALLVACDQWRTLAAAARAGLAHPPTRLIRRPDAIAAAFDELGGGSGWVKGRRGSQGSHVTRVASRAEALRLGHLYWGAGQSFLLQADRAAAGPVERHFVIGERVVAAARALPAAGEFRSNAHRGGRFIAIEPRDSAAAALAVAALAAVGLPFGAVDAIGGPRPELLEVNASPGFEALEAATGRDLAGLLLDALCPREERALLGSAGITAGASLRAR
jgi:ribosomal protein S6--L-glutamate ligase